MGFRYIGSKSKIIDSVVNHIKAILPPPGTVCDLMCGTSAVSSELAANGYNVIANDVMTYSYHHATLSLLIESPPSFEGTAAFIKQHYNNGAPTSTTQYEKLIKALNNVPEVEGYFFKEFSPDGSPKNTEKPRNYFTTKNAKKIDGVRAAIKELADKASISPIEHSLLLHDLIMAANDVANIAGTYGHYLSTTKGRAKDDFEMYSSEFTPTPEHSKHKVIQGYAEDVSGSISCDVCYIDPPYMKRQYAANYHLLETLAREDEPEAIGVSGLRPWRDQYSNFCTKTKIHDSFRKIFSDMDCKHFLVSYSEDGLLSVEQLSDLLSEFGDVNISYFMHKRFKSNDSKLDPLLKEYIIHLEKA